MSNRIPFMDCMMTPQEIALAIDVVTNQETGEMDTRVERHYHADRQRWSGEDMTRVAAALKEIATERLAHAGELQKYRRLREIGAPESYTGPTLVE